MTTQTKTTWRRVKLGEIVTERGSVSGPFGSNIHSRFYAKTGVPIIRGNNLTIGISGGRYIDDDYIYLSKEKAEELSQSEALPDDIVITARGTIGQTGIVPHKSKYSRYILSANQLRFRINKNVADPIFVYYWLSSKPMVRTMQNISVNVGVPNFNLKNARELLIPLPSPEDQKCIAEILSAFDDKIELNNKISRTLEEMVQAIFKEWFVKSEKLKVKSEKLSNLVKTQYGYTESASEKEIGPKFLRVKDINKTDWVDWNTVPYCKISDSDFPKYRLRKGDVVIARMADPGKVAIVEEDIDAVFASYLIRLQIVSDEITPYFLFYYLRSRLYQDFIFGASTGTTRQSANARVITDVELAVPPKEKILEFENLTSTIRGKMSATVKENQKLAALRDLLLPKLMSGALRV